MTAAWLVLTLVFVGFLYASCCDTEILGFIHDDGIYAVTGKALAEGRGYRLIHLLTEPAQVKYPVLYPLAIAACWLLNPHYPGNILWFSWLTVGFSLLALGLFFYYARRCHGMPAWLAYLMMLAVAGNFYFIYASTAVLSESLYLLLSLATLFCLEKTRKTFSPRQWNTLGITLGVLSALTFHARLVGIALIAAIGLYLLLRREFKALLFYGGTVTCLALLPWAFWTGGHRPEYLTAPLNDIDFPLLFPYSAYGGEFLGHVLSEGYWIRLVNSLGSLVYSLLEAQFTLIPQFFKIYPHAFFADHPAAIRLWLISVLVCSYSLLGYFLLQAIGFLRQAFASRTLDGLSPSALYLSLYLAMITLWGYPEQMNRFLVVILPLLWIFFFKPLLPRFSLPKIRTAVALIMILALWPASHSFTGIHRIRTEHRIAINGYRELWQEYKDSFRFARESLPADAVLATCWDTVWYLETGRKTYYLTDAGLRKVRGQIPDSSYQAVFNSMTAYEVGYLVVEPFLQGHRLVETETPEVRYFLSHYSSLLTPVYRSPKGMIEIYRIKKP